MNSANPHLGSAIQSRDILEFRLKTVGRMKEKLLLPNPEHTSGQDQQGGDNENSQSKSSGHISHLRPWPKNCDTNSSLLRSRSSKLPSALICPSWSSTMRSEYVRAP